MTNLNNQVFFSEEKECDKIICYFPLNTKNNKTKYTFIEGAGSCRFMSLTFFATPFAGTHSAAQQSPISPSTHPPQALNLNGNHL